MFYHWFDQSTCAYFETKKYIFCCGYRINFFPTGRMHQEKIESSWVKILRSLIKFVHSSSWRSGLFFPFYRQGDQILERCYRDTCPIQPTPASRLSSLLNIACSAPGSSVRRWEFLCRNDPTGMTDQERDRHGRISVRNGRSISPVSRVPFCGP